MADVIDTLEIARQFKRRYEADRAELVTRAYLDHALERHAVELRAELVRLERDVILKLGGACRGAGRAVLSWKSSAQDATWCPCRRTWQGHRMRAGHLQD
jgi:hypothetical protein